MINSYYFAKEKNTSNNRIIFKKKKKILTYVHKTNKEKYNLASLLIRTVKPETTKLNKIIP